MLCKSVRPGGETGRRTGLKIPGPERDVPVRFRSRAPFKPSALDRRQLILAFSATVVLGVSDAESWPKSWLFSVRARSRLEIAAAMSLLSVMAYRLNISLVFQPPMSMMVGSGTPALRSSRAAELRAVEPTCSPSPPPDAQTAELGHRLLATGGIVSFVTILCNAQ
jgi:hypothetical protein